MENFEIFSNGGNGPPPSDAYRGHWRVEHEDIPYYSIFFQKIGTSQTGFDEQEMNGLTVFDTAGEALWLVTRDELPLSGAQRLGKYQEVRYVKNGYAPWSPTPFAFDPDEHFVASTVPITQCDFGDTGTILPAGISQSAARIWRKFNSTLVGETCAYIVGNVQTNLGGSVGVDLEIQFPTVMNRETRGPMGLGTLGDPPIPIDLANPNELNVAIPDPVTDDETPVGSSPATAQVSPSGDLRYTIPITVPPGTSGMTPELALAYSSNAPFGIAGKGWSLSGGSAITRCSKGPEYGDMDGLAPVRWSPDDALCLDGERLVDAPTDWGACPAVSGRTVVKMLATERQTFQKICVYRNTKLNPQMMVVYRKDGTHAIYGDGNGSRMAQAPFEWAGGSPPVVQWSLARVEDRLGNYITYHYDKLRLGKGAPITSQRLARVEYTKKATGTPSARSTPFATVEFDYCEASVFGPPNTTCALDNSDVRVRYASGVEYLDRSLLTKVRVMNSRFAGAPLQEIRSYDLNYLDDTSGLPLLDRVQECAPNPGGVLTQSCYNPILLTYAKSSGNDWMDTQGSNRASVLTGSGALDLTRTRGVRPADINGDGLLDIVSRYNGNGGFDQYQIAIQQVDTQSARRTFRASASSGNMPDTHQEPDQWHLIDVDLDGRTDLLRPGGNSGSETWFVETSNGLNFGNAVNTSIAFDGDDLNALADLNGDGILDLQIVSGIGANRTARVHLGLAQSPYFAAVSIPIEFSGTLRYRNGEGFLRSFTADQGALFNARQPLRQADINGDGLADYSAYVRHTADCEGRPGLETSNVYFVLINGGLKNAKFTFHANYAISGDTNLLSCDDQTRNPPLVGDVQPSRRGLTVDMNGDRLDDLVLMTSNIGGDAGTLDVYLNTGAGAQAVDAPSFSLARIASASVNQINRVQFVDLDHDGATDIIYPAPNDDCLNDQMRARYWRGTTFSASVCTSIVGKRDRDVGGGTVSQTNFLLDWNGDGIVDNITMELNQNNDIDYYYASIQAEAVDGLVGIENGLGERTTIEYAPLTDAGVYRRGEIVSPNRYVSYGAGSSVLDIFAPHYVVKRLSADAPAESDVTSPGNPRTKTLRYFYEGGRIQTGGRGSLGFARHYVLDNKADQQLMETVTEFFQNYPFNGRTKRSETRAYKVLGGGNSPAERPFYAKPLSNCRDFSGGDGLCFATRPACANNLCDSFDNATAFQVVGQQDTLLAQRASGAQSVFVYPDVVVETTRDLASGNVLSMVQTDYDYATAVNNYGFVTGQTVRTFPTAIAAGAPLKTVTSVFSYLTPDLGEDWELGRLSTSAVTTTYANQSTTRTARFSYDAKGLLTSESLESGSAAFVRHGYAYDDFGNQIKHATCDNAMSASACQNLSFTALQWTPNGASSTAIRRLATSQFDTQGRYLLAATEGFRASEVSNGTAVRVVQQIVERNQHGDILEARDVNGVSTLNRYEPLGRLYFSIDATGARTKQNYRYCSVVDCPREAVYRVDHQSAGNAQSWQYFDRVGREIMTVEKRYEYVDALDRDKKTFWATATHYDVNGRLERQSEPYQVTDKDGRIATSPVHYTTTTHDVLNRPVLAARALDNPSAPNDREDRFTYLDLRTQVENCGRNPNAGNRFYCVRSATQNNAVGFTVESTQYESANFFNGARTVHFEHDGYGNVLEARRTGLTDQGVNKTTRVITQYDGLGRRTAMFDADLGANLANPSSPSNGWNYQLNGLGEVIEAQGPGVCFRSHFDARGRAWTQTSYSNRSCTVVDRAVTQIFDTRSPGQVSKTTQTVSASGGAAAYAVNLSYTYDDKGRVDEMTTTHAGADTDNNVGTSSNTTKSTYDQYGRLYQYFDIWDVNAQGEPTGNVRGTLYQYKFDRQRRVRDAFPLNVGRVYHEVLNVDGRGNIVAERLGGNDRPQVTRTYEPETGLVTSIRAGTNASLQNWSYQWDDLGNMRQRTDVHWKADNSSQVTLSERFDYDALNRLSRVQKRVGLTGGFTTTFDLDYDGLGRILTLREGGATYGYDGDHRGLCGGAAPGPHAQTQVYNAAGALTRHNCYDGRGNRTDKWNASKNQPGQQVDYTVFDKPSAVYKGGPSAAFSSRFLYGPADELILRVDQGPNSGDTGASTNYTTIFGTVEYRGDERDREQTLRRTLPGGLVVTEFADARADRYRYLLKDALGSTDALVTDTGGLDLNLQRLSFDSYGQRRDPDTWTLLSGAAVRNFDQDITDTGFTGHRMVDATNMVHMGGRLYQANDAVFVTPDPVVQSPENFQNWNRYAYVVNNPMSYTDPSGYSFLALAAGAGLLYQSHDMRGKDQLKLFASIGVTIATSGWGAGWAIAGGATAGYITGGSEGALWGAISASTAAGIHHAFGPSLKAAQEAGRSTTALYAAKAAAHGVTATAIHYGRTGDWDASAFASGAITVGTSPLVERLSDPGGRIIAAAAIGGTTSRITGGKFANGALTAVFVRAYNDDLCTLDECRSYRRKMRDPGARAHEKGVEIGELGELALEAGSIFIPGAGIVRVGNVSARIAVTAKRIQDTRKIRASDLVEIAESHGWKRTQSANGPIKYFDANGVRRITIKQGSQNAPGSNFPHVEFRNADDVRVDVMGMTTTRKGPLNHTPIEYDL